METVDDVIAHFGTKGMKWGVRKSGTSSGPEAVRVTAAPGKKVKTAGGKGHAPTHEAIDAAVSRQKAKKSTAHSLSNKELQDAIKRMQLEQQFTQLNYQTKGVGGKFVDNLLGRSGNVKADTAARRDSTDKVKKGLALAKAAKAAKMAAVVV